MHFKPIKTNSNFITNHIEGYNIKSVSGRESSMVQICAAFCNPKNAREHILCNMFYVFDGRTCIYGYLPPVHAVNMENSGGSHGVGPNILLFLDRAVEEFV